MRKDTVEKIKPLIEKNLKEKKIAFKQLIIYERDMLNLIQIIKNAATNIADLIQNPEKIEPENPKGVKNGKQ